MNTALIATPGALIEEVVQGLETAIAGGARQVTATDIGMHVVLRFGIALWSRALAVGRCADYPPAAAAMYDLVRSMCEAAAHLSWLSERPEVLTERAACIELGQALADRDNRRNVLSAHQQQWVPDHFRAELQRGLEASEERVQRLRRQHLAPCPHCKGHGRDEGGVQPTLKHLATRNGATAAEVNLFTLWVGCSGDAHQLTPQRHARVDGNFIDLEPQEIGKVVRWTIDVLFYCAPLIARAVRPPSVREVENVRSWYRSQLSPGM